MKRKVRIAVGVFQSADLEHVWVIPALTQRGVGEDKPCRFVKGKQPFLVFQYQVVSRNIVVFIDEVAKYRQYDENGDEVLGEYGVMFEEEYISILNEYITLLDAPYQKYLKSTGSDVHRVHKGYFSIDKRT